MPVMKTEISIGLANGNTRTMPGKVKMGYYDDHGGE
jgi:hypothetical protein